MTELRHGNTIVVGVDGSEASMAALRWSTEQARTLGADVVAVHAWEPAGPGMAPYAPASARPTVAEQRVQAAELLASTLREVFGHRIDSTVRAVLVEGPPARVLLRQSRDARLLALGRKAHGQYGLPAIGTVGRECLRHATIPVIAVPTADRSVSPLSAVTTSALPRSGAA
jgi:nucleotide-binding universal stress UspA family protein